MNTHSWKHIISSITRELNSNPKNIGELAAASQLTESTVRGFLPLTNFKELILHGKSVYILNNQPKKIPTVQLVKILLKTSDTLDNVKYLSVKDMYNKLHDFAPTIECNNFSSQIYQMSSRGVLDRKGLPGSYTYCLSDTTKKVTAKVGGMADQLIAIAEYVEKSEVKQIELEKENQRLTKELNTIKAKLKNMLGNAV